MAKKVSSKKVKRSGGKREGAGRKPLLDQIAPLAERVHIAEESRKYAHRAVARLLFLMEHASSEDVQKTSAIYILNRGYGTPPQSVELSNKPGEALRVQATYEEFLTTLDAVANKKAQS